MTGATKNLVVDTFSAPVGYFGALLAFIVDFAGGEKVPPAQGGWYSYLYYANFSKNKGQMGSIFSFLNMCLAYSR